MTAGHPPRPAPGGTGGTASAVTTAEAIARAVAAHGLATRAVLPAHPLEDDLWDAAWPLIRHHRIEGFAAHAVDEGAFAVTDQQGAVMRLAHMMGTALVLQLEKTLLDVAALFEDAGIDYRALKGPALVHSGVYPSASQRSFCDIDVLVPSEEFDRAVAVLEESGATRRYAQPRVGFDRRFSKGASFVTGDGMAIDLHRTLVLGPFGLRVDLPALWSVSGTIELAGRSLAVLPPEETFVHVCFHAALGDWPPRLTPMRDIAQCAASGGVDFDRALAVAARWRATAVVAAAVTMTWDVLELETHDIQSWALRHQPSAREQRMLELYRENRSYKRLALAALPEVPGVVQKMAYLRSLAMPNPSYLEDRDRTLLRRWRTALRLLRAERLRR